MGDWMIYLLKVSGFQAILMLFYLVFLRRLTFFRLSRFYLLGTLLVAFILPALHVERTPVQEVNQRLVQMIATRVEQVSFMAEVQDFSPRMSWPFLWSLIYGSGLVLFLRRYVSNFRRIIQLTYNDQPIDQIGAVRVFRTSCAQPFSFFNSVFVPSQVEQSPDHKLVMAHELQHVRYGHSYDRMLADFILVLFWFNPFMYLLRRSLIEIHEYQADCAVTAAHDKVCYQIALVRLVGTGFSGPVSFFNFSTIKKRIEMMNKHRSKKYSLLILLALVPVLGSMVMLFSFDFKLMELSPVDFPRRFELNTVEVPDDPRIPSVFPVAAGGKVTVSSHFGLRTNPLNGQSQPHIGLDIKGPIGTDVLATADGKVQKVVNATWGYGLHLVIDHGNGYTTKYAHLSAFNVKEGEEVKRGQVIAYMGNSGKSNGSHLHYEVRKNEQPVNPVDYISDYRFEEE